MAGNRSGKQRLTDCGLLRLDLVGTQFGSTTICSRKVQGSSWNLLVEVVCSECGWSGMVRYHNMKKGRRVCQVCAPYRRRIKSPRWLYQRCQAQQDRCTNPANTEHKNYGGRGIEFGFESPWAAAEWIAENLGVPESKSAQIDRISNNGHYEPGNLRWVFQPKNVRNSRKSTGAIERFWRFRERYPKIKYADATLKKLCGYLSDKEIIARWNTPSCKPKGKYGTFSTQDPGTVSPRMIA